MVAEFRGGLREKPESHLASASHRVTKGIPRSRAGEGIWCRSRPGSQLLRPGGSGSARSSTIRAGTAPSPQARPEEPPCPALPCPRAAAGRCSRQDGRTFPAGSRELINGPPMSPPPKDQRDLPGKHRVPPPRQPGSARNSATKSTHSLPPPQKNPPPPLAHRSYFRKSEIKDGWRSGYKGSRAIAISAKVFKKTKIPTKLAASPA